MYRRKTLPHILAAAAERWGPREAIVTPERRISFADLDAEVRRAAAAFVHAGLAHGDRVAIWSHNCVDWVVGLLGVQAAGGVVVPINTRYKADEAALVLDRSKARFLLVADRFLGVDYPAMLRGVALPHLERIVRLDSPESRPGEWAAFLDEAGAADLAVARARRDALGEDDVSDIMFTSGTTGEPKGAVTCHGQNVRTYELWNKATGLSASDRYVSVWPFFHCAGYKSAMLASLIAGATLYPQTRLDSGDLIRLIVSERITVLPGPPTLFQTLLAQDGAGEGRFSSLRIATIGAASVPPSLIDAIRDRLGIRKVVTGYGLTETCGTVTMSEETDSAEIVVTTCGHPLDGIEVRIMDGGGAVLPIGGVGEIMVRGFVVMQGYLDDPEATREAITPDGWLHTGDIGALDERGYLRITDRKKDVFIVGGFNCYPAEIEKIMLRNDAIAQVAVIGVPDERMGEVAKAFVVRKEGAALTEEAVIAWARGAMANFKVPRHVEIVDALPTNATGKVQKFRL